MNQERRGKGEGRGGVRETNTKHTDRQTDRKTLYIDRHTHTVYRWYID